MEAASVIFVLLLGQALGTAVGVDTPTYQRGAPDNDIDTDERSYGGVSSYSNIGAYAGGYSGFPYYDGRAASRNFGGGYSGNFYNFVPPNFGAYPIPYSANPYENPMASYFQEYFNALQNYHNRLQQQFISSFPNNPYGTGVPLSVGASSSSPGGTQISVSAPPGAHVEHFQGPGGLQGVAVSHETFSPPNSGGPHYGGSFSSASSSTSSVNGHTDTFQSSTVGVNNNGQVSSITVTKP